MKLTIEISQQELDSMNISSEKLAQLVSDKVDSITVKKQKIIHQTELNIQIKIVNKS